MSEVGKITSMTGLSIIVETNAIYDFRLRAAALTDNYADVRVKVDGVEKQFTYPEFLAALGFTE